MQPVITDSLLITGQQGIITDLNVSIELTHTWINDLVIELTSPSGTTVALFNNQCADENDIVATFDDEGYALVCPPSGFLAASPFETLSAFDGEGMNGTWILTVTDGYPPEDNGILNEWCLMPSLFLCTNHSECSDGDLCTIDSCNSGVCSNPPKICADSEPCTKDACNRGACTHVPLNPGNFSTFMNAEVVIGQPDFFSNNMGYSQSLLYGPSYCAISSKGVLAVALQHGAGVFLWNTMPATDGQPADVVVGNPDFSAPVNACSQSLTSFTHGVAFSPDGNKLLVSDAGNNRVLIWNTIPVSNGQPANVVLGQPDFVTSTSGTGNSKFDTPQGIFVSRDGKLIVADRYNNRVLIWNSIPAVSNTPANVVVGQPDFNSITSGNSASKMSEPWGVWVTTDGKLLVADEQNNRVLIFNQVPTTNGASADIVVGQTGFGTSIGGTTNSRFYAPVGVTVTPEGKMVVGEFQNNRVLIFSSVPAANGASADVVLGQNTFTAALDFAPAGLPARNNFLHPYNVSTDLNGRIFAAGRDMNRILVFGDLPCKSADLHANISATSPNQCDAAKVISTFIISNEGNDTATTIMSMLAFSPLFSIDSVSATAGLFNSSRKQWSIPTLAAGDSAALTVYFTMNNPAGMVQEVSGIIQSSGAIDPDMSDNTSTVEVNCNVTISGTVMTETSSPVNTVILRLSGTQSTSDTTENTGLYSFKVPKGGTYTVTPSKRNDIQTNNGNTTFDIVQIRRHILSSLLLDSPYKIIAADVNGTNTVTTTDIVFIRSVILQINQSFPNGRLWSFVPADYVFADPMNPFPFPGSKTLGNVTSSLTQHFIAMKLGDVNNSWDPTIAKTGAVGEVLFLMDEQFATPGQEITVPVRVRDFNGITGYQFTLSWNAKVLHLLEVNNLELNGYYGMQKAAEGFLTTSWDDEMGRAITLSDNEPVFELMFKVTGESGTYSEIKIGSEMTVSEAYNENLDLLTIISGNGSVKVGDVNVLNTQPSLLNTFFIHPNPFNRSTHIIFSIPKDETVTLFIYDIFGREVRYAKNYYKAGEHQFEWKGDDFSGQKLSSGLYQIKILAGGCTFSGKAVMLR